MTTKNPKPLSAAELSAIAGKEQRRGDCTAREILEAAASIREGLDNLADAVREQTEQQNGNAHNLCELLQRLSR